MPEENNPKQNILIVDDRPINLVVLRGLLEEHEMSDQINIIEASSGNEALGLVLEHDFSLILLDVQMPDMDGFETAELMRGIERSRDVPIIFVTAISKEQKFIFKGYQIGAVDYLFKPLDPHVLHSKVRVFLKLDMQRKKLEELNQTLRDTVVELEKSKQIIEDQNKALHELAIKDGLTGVYNHRHFKEILEREITMMHRYKRSFCLLLMDLDFFKRVNDTFGHLFGDFVLRGFVNIVQSVIRESDIMARFGGEEFEVLLSNTDLKGAVKVAEKIKKLSEAHIYKEGENSIRVTVSIGVTCCHPGTDVLIEDLIAEADKALYMAKELGRNRVEPNRTSAAS